MPDLFTAAEENTGSVEEVLHLLDKLQNQGVLQPPEVEIVRWLNERLGESRQPVLLAAAHLTSLTRQGHVGTRIPLREAKVPLFGHDGSMELTKAEREKISRWKKKMIQALEESSIIGSAEDPHHPLIYDRGYLYYQRYWSYECMLSQTLLGKADQKMTGFHEEKAIDWIQKLFPGDESGTHWQHVALWIALTRRLLILTGGPGTGKTYTLIRIVALRQLLKQKDGKSLNIALAAPTGKAAARINESIGESIEPLQELLPGKLVDELPRKAQTLHRLLGTGRNKPEFRHNADNPLPHDIVVVDEVSMVDIAMMTNLMEALKEDAQIILIGDKDQLASVEAGSVLGDICTPLLNDGDSRDSVNLFSEEFHEEVRRKGLTEMPADHSMKNAPALLNCMVELTESRRFREAPEIGILANKINQGKSEQALAELEEGSNVQIELPGFLSEIRRRCERWNYTQREFVLAEALSVFEDWREYQVLCAHRRGPRSAEAVNYLIDHWMREKKNIRGAGEGQQWYPGRPVIVTKNNYDLDLYNGDIGITVRDPEQGNQLRVCFEKSDEVSSGVIRTVAPAQLTQYEPAWALTVHKSQGSEFDEVLLVMPERLSPILTRELIYTALTRARRKFTVWSESAVFKRAISQQIQRTSALGERLWEEKS